MTDNYDSTTHSGSEIHKIEILRGHEDYVLWRRRELDALEELGVEDTVYSKGPPKPKASDSTETPESDTDDESGNLVTSASASVSAEDLEAWKKRSRKALRHIRARVGKRLGHLVVNATTAYEAWQALERECYPKGFSAIVQIYLKLASMKQQDGANIPEHVRNVDRKSTRLNSSHSGESRMPSSA